MNSYISAPVTEKKIVCDGLCSFLTALWACQVL